LRKTLRFQKRLSVFRKVATIPVSSPHFSFMFDRVMGETMGALAAGRNTHNGYRPGRGRIAAAVRPSGSMTLRQKPVSVCLQ
jgi:hypothetical protein